MEVDVKADDGRQLEMARKGGSGTRIVVGLVSAYRDTYDGTS